MRETCFQDLRRPSSDVIGRLDQMKRPQRYMCLTEVHANRVRFVSDSPMCNVQPCLWIATAVAHTTCYMTELRAYVILPTKCRPITRGCASGLASGCAREFHCSCPVRGTTETLNNCFFKHEEVCGTSSGSETVKATYPCSGSRGFLDFNYRNYPSTTPTKAPREAQSALYDSLNPVLADTDVDVQPLNLCWKHREQGTSNL